MQNEPPDKMFTKVLQRRDVALGSRDISRHAQSGVDAFIEAVIAFGMNTRIGMNVVSRPVIETSTAEGWQPLAFCDSSPDFLRKWRIR